MRSFTVAYLLVLFLFSSCASSVNTPYFEDSGRFPANFQTCFQAMNSLVNYHQFSDANESLLTTAGSLKELESAYGRESLIDLQRRFDDPLIKQININTQKLLTKPLDTQVVIGKTHFVTKGEAKTILDAIKNSKVNRDHYCYDPTRKTGFCFGRAVIGHMEALVRNVHPDSIKKIWIAGDMKEWGHHVAPMVKGEEGWWVLDTNIGYPLTPIEWQNYYGSSKAKNAKEIMVFVTQAGRFGPYDSETYSTINLFNTVGHEFDRENDFYKGYFHDYFEALDKNEKIQKFPAR